MTRIPSTTLVLLVCAGLFSSRAVGQVVSTDTSLDWTHFVRIGAYGLRNGNARSIVESARKDHVFGIEVDNDVTGRYESFLDPTAKLKAIQEIAERAHQAGNRAFVYIAGTECITANADSAAHSVLKDHPDWLQRKRTGEPAVFTSGAAFWIRPGDEDVWISPYAPDWRKTYMQRVRQIAATGIDGIYVDIPYWMTHFDGWEDSWASFDDSTVAAFRRETGLDARNDLKLGDFQDENFRKWIDFRIATLTGFMREIRQNAQAVRPEIKVIPEIYPGIEEEATRVGADVYQMYDVVDAIAHEYEFGGGDHMASSRTPLDWFLYQAGMLTFRAFAQGKATWILNYSWDGDKNSDPREAMKNLAMSQLMDGANFWDAPGHSMAGSNDSLTRAEIFQWIEANQSAFYTPRKPMHPVGVYFSPKSRDYAAAEFLPEYRGVLLLLLQSHLEFQVVTPRTLEDFRGDALILPNVQVLGAAEKALLQRLLRQGSRLIVTGRNPTDFSGSPQVLHFSNPGKAFLETLQRNFSAGSANMPADFLQALTVPGGIQVEAAPSVAVNLASVGGVPHIFLANFSGIIPGRVAIPAVQSGIRVRAPAAMGNELSLLPFLGKVRMVQGQEVAGRMEFALPPVERGAVLWIANNQAAVGSK